MARAKKPKETMEEKAAREMKERLMARTSAARQASQSDRSGINPEMFAVLKGRGITATVRPVHQNANVDFEYEERLEHDEADENFGEVIKARRGRRVNNVFHTLEKAKTITRAQMIVGDEVASIYAASKGLSDPPEKRIFDQVDNNRGSSPEIATDHMIDNGWRFMDIMTRIQPIRYKKMFKALIRDMVTGDGAGNIVIDRDKDGKAMTRNRERVRWRTVMHYAIGVKDDEAQARAMRAGIIHLVAAKEASDKAWAVRMKEKNEKREKFKMAS
ncbi:MAG TPA: hypothetical protein VLZ84_10160 [Asticcacaulis sp.]|nr:hypothetical protein [Asticcacaulis sp.]